MHWSIGGLGLEDLEGIEGAKFARLKFGPCDARVIKYPANTKIPLHKHSGETLKIVLSGKIAFEDGSPSAESYAHYAAALKAAYETRLATMGDADDVRDPACTTHLTTIDGEGNMVALTQTLLK